MLVKVSVLLGVVVPCGLENEVVSVLPLCCDNVNVIVDDPESENPVILLV